jgi:hypothetical protein
MTTRKIWVLGLFLNVAVSFSRGSALGQEPTQAPPKVNPAAAWFDPKGMAPQVGSHAGNSDLLLDEAGRIQFKSIRAIAGYFDHWLAEDDRLMARQGLVQQAVRLAYGNSWQGRNPTQDDSEYKNDLRKKLLWVFFLPKFSLGTQNQISSVVTIPGTLPSPGTRLPSTVTANLQTAYNLTWDVGTSMFQRTATKDALDARLAAQYKMKTDALKALSDAYTARRVAQLQLRSSLFEVLVIHPTSSERIKDLRKAIDVAYSEVIKADLEIDLVAGGAASGAYEHYRVFVP